MWEIWMIVLIDKILLHEFNDFTYLFLEILFTSCFHILIINKRKGIKKAQCIIYFFQSLF